MSDGTETVLRVVLQHPGLQTHEIAGIMGVTSASVSKKLARLVKDDYYIERRTVDDEEWSSTHYLYYPGRAYREV